ncbi:reticulophagy regulator 1 isoform X2 [Bufo bufo]|uniref:reticulophagy regulator 1 isoform X2 n=1 Tax=Bufo bufo TaxID=8384 RepID=UPI001ABE1B8C|nr:reticulophagy regulator 1 isoform X2 [Bufo bufo]
MAGSGERTAGREPEQPLWGEMLVRAADIVTWQRPLYSLAVFICCNFLFWFLACAPWRIYHIVSLISIGLVMVQITRHFLLSRSRGAQVWKGIVRRWEVISANSECKPRLSQCIAESWSSYTIFLHELSHYKQQNPGKFCLLVCSLCTFLILLGSYIPGVVLSYFTLLCAFLCPLLKCNEIGQKACSKLKPVLQKLDFGLQSFLSLWMKAKSKKDTKTTTAEDSELEISALCPQLSPEAAAKELSISGTEPSDLSWTENGTFNLSEGYTPQTDTSDDLDRPSEEEAFSRGLTEFPSPENGSGSNDEDSIGIPSTLKRKHKKSHKSSAEKCSTASLSTFLGNEQPYNLVASMAGEAITAAITDQLQSALLRSQPPAASFTEDTDIEEADDFELLDQSELEDIDDEMGLSSSQESEGKKPSPGFLSSLLGGH